MLGLPDEDALYGKVCFDQLFDIFAEDLQALTASAFDLFDALSSISEIGFGFLDEGVVERVPPGDADFRISCI